jgi:hypothetical protein
MNQPLKSNQNTYQGMIGNYNYLWCFNSVANTVKDRENNGAIIPILLVIPESQDFPCVPRGIPDHFNDSIIKLLSSFFSPAVGVDQLIRRKKKISHKMIAG